MKKIPIIAAFVFICLSVAVGQIANATLVRIVKAEDSRAYDKSLEDLIKSLLCYRLNRALLIRWINYWYAALIVWNLYTVLAVLNG